MSTLYVATTNRGKLRDFAEAAAAAGGASPWKIEPLPGLATLPTPAEDELTFEGNARAKALAYSAHAPNLLVVADDSGLEVDALGGAPGVFSARYAERAGIAPLSPQETTDQRNNRHLLAELARVLLQQGLLAHLDHRRARYRCVLAAARNGELVATAEGTLEGMLLTEPHGTGGFGYDPLFFLPELNQTMAEVDPATRFSISHRGRALRRLLATLEAVR